MTVLIVAAGVLLLFIGCFFFLGAAFRFLQAIFKTVFVFFFASDRQVDDMYMKDVLEKKPDFKAHSDAVDQTVNDILKN